MVESFNVREARAEDAAEIFAIWKDGLSVAVGSEPIVYVGDHLKYFENLVQTQTEVSKVWVAIRGDKKIVGWQSLLPCRNNPVLRGLMAESSTYVRRKAGVPRLGQLLLAHACQYAARTPLQHIIGFAGTSNRASLRIVRATGFEHIGVVPRSRKKPTTTEVSIYIYVVPQS
jgi:L-amino acid N-acyltransferase YncA